jgi:voltage-gated potassium channel
VDSSTPDPKHAEPEGPPAAHTADKHFADDSIQEASKRELIGMIALGVLMVAGFAFIPPKSGPVTWVDIALFFSGLALLSGGVFYMIIREYKGTARRDVRFRILSLFVLIIAMVMFFAISFYRLSTVSGEIDGLQTHLDAIYFTISTTMTVGFGDVVAKGQVGRFVVIVQMLFNLIVLAAASKLILNLVGRRTRSQATQQ